MRPPPAAINSEEMQTRRTPEQSRATEPRPSAPKRSTNVLLGASANAFDLTTGVAEALWQRAFARRYAGGQACDSVLWEDFTGDLKRESGALNSLDGDAVEILAEEALREVEQHTRDLLREISPVDPFRRVWAADSVLAKCCYLVCRMLRPDVVVETGVAYGVSSAFILRAMRENGSGTLHSVDLRSPLRGSKGFRGIAVPPELRKRWTLHHGSSRRLLAPLARDLGTVDLFLHDSLHTRRNMLREFAAVWPHLREGGVVIADDVERNTAFTELLRRKPALWRVVSDFETEPLHGSKAPITFGVAVK